jgi:DNA polymerase-3 subunit delta'
LLAPDAIAQALHEREGIEPTQAAVLARMADGSYARALDLAGNEELLAGRQLVLDFLRYAYANNVDRLADLTDQMAGMGRERLKGTFTLMLRWIRDLLLFRAMGAEAPLVNVDQQDAIERFCKNIPGADLEAMTLLVEQAMELVERNVHQGLIITTLAQRLHQTMRGTPAPRLYIPLVEANGLHP